MFHFIQFFVYYLYTGQLITGSRRAFDNVVGAPLVNEKLSQEPEQDSMFANFTGGELLALCVLSFAR